MINPIRRLYTLKPGEVITDKLFDDLRYGDTVVAAWVNEFGSAAAMQTACEEYDQRISPIGESRYHPAWRMYRGYSKKSQRQGISKAEKSEEDKAALEWSRATLKAEGAQLSRIKAARKSKRRYL